MILISLKTVFSACIYKFYLGRSTTNMQIFGAVLIVLSVVVTKLPTIIYRVVQLNFIKYFICCLRDLISL